MLRCPRFLRASLLTAALLAGSIATAAAQTTLVLNAPGTQVTDTMIQAGSFANTNFNASDVLATRASTNVEYLRRALLKFDTQNTLPANTTVKSATMTLTIKYGGADANRVVTVLPVTTSFVEQEATWNLRRIDTAWTSAGGDFGPAVLAQKVPNVAGAKVAFDVTALVQAAVNGGSSSRYTRLALADLGASTSASYREYYSTDALEPSVRPTLTIVYGAPAPATPAAATNTLAVLSAPAAAAPSMCTVALDKTALNVGQGEANWTITVSTAATCAWSAASDVEWLVVRSTTPATATGNGSVKVKAITNTVSSVKRIGHLSVNGVVYTVTQGGCGTGCTTPAPTEPVVTPPVVPPPAPPVVTPPVVPPPAPGTPATLRVLQYNTHHGGYGTDGVYSIERIVDVIVKSNADLVSLNEVEVKDSWSKGLDQTVLYHEMLQQKTNRTWYKVYFNRSGADTGLGQLILSKYPFIATAPLLLSANRSAIDATIDVNGRIVNFTSLHIDNETQANRLRQISEFLPWATTLAENRIVVGDFNAWPNTTEIANMQKTYVDTWAAAKTAGTAVSWPANPEGITHAYHRIDYIFLSKGAAALTLKSVQVFDTSDHSGKKCSVSGAASCYSVSDGIDPSDHRPVMATFDVR